MSRRVTRRIQMVLFGWVLMLCGCQEGRTAATPQVAAQKDAPPKTAEEYLAHISKESKNEIGRFQIVTGPSHSPILLDTASGQTWILCEHKNAEKGWCVMPRGTKDDPLGIR